MKTKKTKHEEQGRWVKCPKCGGKESASICSTCTGHMSVFVPEPWPTPWTTGADGTFGNIEAANGEPVAQVQPLSPRFERDVVKRNEWRNTKGAEIAAAMTACTGMTDPVAEIKRLQEGEQWAAGMFCEIMAVALSGFADAVIVANQKLDAGHTLATVKKLADECKALRAIAAEAQAFIAGEDEAIKKLNQIHGIETNVLSSTPLRKALAELSKVQKTRSHD